jgi:uncharacterized protein (DUF1330 family)
MSAYVIIEFTVKDPHVVREKYSPNAARMAKEHGGEGYRQQQLGDAQFLDGQLERLDCWA